MTAYPPLMETGLSVDERWDRFAENPVPLWLKLDRWMGMYISFNKMTSKKSRL